MTEQEKNQIKAEVLQDIIVAIDTALEARVIINDFIKRLNEREMLEYIKKTLHKKLEIYLGGNDE